MAKKFKIKGETTEEKFTFLEKYLKHMRRRARKAIVGVMSPTHIHSYVDHPNPNGVVLKFVIPADGKILKGVLSIGSYNVKTLINVSCSVEGKSKKISRNFETKKNVNAIVADIGVEVGDVLSVVIDPIKNDNDEWSVSDVQVSILYEIFVKDSILKEFAFKELDKAVEEDDEGI